MRDDEEPRSTPVDPTLFRSGWVRVGTTERWEAPDGAELEIQVALEEEALDSARMLIDTVGEPLSADEKTPTSPGGSLLPIETPIAGRSLRGTVLGLAVAGAALSITVALVWGGGGAEPMTGPRPRPTDTSALSVARQTGTALRGQSRVLTPSSEPTSGQVDVLDIDLELPDEEVDIAHGAGLSIEQRSTRQRASSERVAATPVGEPAPRGSRERATGELAAVPRAEAGAIQTELQLRAGSPGGSALVAAAGSAPGAQPRSGAAVPAGTNARRGPRSDTHVLLDQQSPY